MTCYIYHIVSEEDWKNQQANDVYAHPSLEAEGFIHCSLKVQVKGVISRYFDSKEGLLVLTIEPSQLLSPLKMEVSIGNENYPHVYGPIHKGAILSVETISNWMKIHLP